MIDAKIRWNHLCSCNWHLCYILGLNSIGLGKYAGPNKSFEKSMVWYSPSLLYSYKTTTAWAPVRLVFKSGLWWRAAYNGANTEFRFIPSRCVHFTLKSVPIKGKILGQKPSRRETFYKKLFLSDHHITRKQYSSTSKNKCISVSLNRLPSTNLGQIFYEFTFESFMVNDFTRFISLFRIQPKSLSLVYIFLQSCFNT